MPSCTRCHEAFEITETERRHHELVSPIVNGRVIPIPLPKQCPLCRRIRRMAFRNGRELYSRVCPQTGKTMVSLYSPDKNLNIVSPDWWLSDAWNPLDYGKDWDASRSFFSQVLGLMRAVPQPALNQSNNENCDYTSSMSGSKNCYMTFLSVECENVAFGDTMAHCKDCIDCMILTSCEACYDCINGSKLYECAHCDDCTGLAFSLWCINCHGSSDLIGCSNLRNKKFCIFNTQYTEEEYQAEKARLLNDPEALAIRAREAMLKAPRPYNHEVACEDVTGDYIFYCTNTQECYSSLQLKDSYNCRCSMASVAIQDVDGGSYDELLYECSSPGDKSYHLGFCYNVVETRDSYYSINCRSCTDCFGCVGLQHKQYCILNKQYTKEEYEALLPQIVAAMGEEWGDFFPIETSPFAYNESMAQDSFPLTEEEAKAHGLSWHHRQHEFQGTGKQVPSVITMEYFDDAKRQELLEMVFTCPVSGFPFKITSLELGFLLKRGWALPQLAPRQRSIERIKRTVPPRLHERGCMNTGCTNTFMTPYAENRPEIIYCKTCYETVVR